jgi:large subunit ribosomal protein L10
MPTVQKEQTVAELREMFTGSQAAILTDYRGLKVSDLTQLRRKLRTVDAEFHIVKNTLFRRATDGLITDEEFLGHLEGPTAIGFAKSDPTGVAKTMLEYAKDHKTFSIKGAYVEGRVLGPEQITALSKLPSKDVLIAQLMGSLNAPIANLVGTLQGVISNFVYTLQAISDQKGAEA